MRPSWPELNPNYTLHSKSFRPSWPELTVLKQRQQTGNDYFNCITILPVRFEDEFQLRFRGSLAVRKRKSRTLINHGLMNITINHLFLLALINDTLYNMAPSLSISILRVALWVQLRVTFGFVAASQSSSLELEQKAYTGEWVVE